MKYDKACYISIFEDRFVKTNEFCNYIPAKKENATYRLKPSNMKYTGNICERSKKLIEKRLTGWINSIKVYNLVNDSVQSSAKTYPVFITLTIPNQRNKTDQEVKRELLELFLKRMVYNEMMFNYFWKAEKQKRGELHFHIVSDRYIDYKYLQRVWNSILYKAGMLDEFFKKYNHYNPPSTHIEALNKIHGAINYAMKYISKESHNDKVSGRVYSFSTKLLNLRPCKLFYEGSNIQPFNEYLSSNIDRIFDREYCSVYYLKQAFDHAKIDKHIQSQYIDYYLAQYNSIYSNTGE